MDRRDFLRVGTVGASTGVAACTRSPAPRPPSPSVGVHEFLRRVDHGMGAIARSSPLADLVAHLGREPSQLPPSISAPDEELFRKSLGALFLASSFRDLPRDEQVDPRVQNVMWGSMDYMNEAVLGVADHLERLSSDKRRAIGSKLREKPDLALDLFEVVDRKAAKVSVDPRRRLHLRNIAMQAGWRLSRQPVGLFIDEHVAKVRTIAARQNEILLSAIAAAPPAVGSEEPSKHTTTNVGAILLGCSVAVGVLGLVLVSAGQFVGVFPITAGVLGAIGGLITLLVGAIIES